MILVLPYSDPSINLFWSWTLAFDSCFLRFVFLLLHPSFDARRQENTCCIYLAKEPCCNDVFLIPSVAD